MQRALQPALCSQEDTCKNLRKSLESRVYLKVEKQQ